MRCAVRDAPPAGQSMSRRDAGFGRRRTRSRRDPGCGCRRARESQKEGAGMIKRSDIQELFASQLRRIKKKGVREKVIDTWMLGCERGGWDRLPELRKMPFTLLTETHGVNFIQHTIAVTEGALALAQAQQKAYRKMPYAIDMDRLIAGGLLHDVGKLLEIEADGEGGWRKSHNGKCARHPISGAMLAAEAGVDEETINIIACHAKEGDGRPQVVETVLIHQADFATFNPLVMKKAGTLIE
ncbi:MAG: HDIG domain-containing protein [Candidatus Eisenbacteria bacterium]|nr:HDIG domain-containing protein [Candidatus Eisenbacteria bacterium]